MLPQIYFYSPLSPTNITEPNHKALLIIFILKEFIQSPEGVGDEQESSPSPFDWTSRGSPVSKLREHFSLLPIAFPELAFHVSALYQNIYQPAQEIISLLEPYIIACQANENLLLFLLKHQNELAVKPILDKICPEGLEILQEKIALSFRKRGYPFIRWTHSSKML
jgi:hypothetical protein